MGVVPTTQTLCHKYMSFADHLHVVTYIVIHSSHMNEIINSTFNLCKSYINILHGVFEAYKHHGICI